MMELNERNREILWSIIQSYIDLNEPVSSHQVTKKCSLRLSPATIRNIMADLEKQGYLNQPYTSAGRVPTDKGYRVYVNALIKEYDPSFNKDTLNELTCKLECIAKDINRLIQDTSKTLSMFSRYLGVATLPKPSEMILRRIEFIKHKKNQVLGILISEEGIVRDRIFSVEENFFQKDLDKIAEYLNYEFKGLTLEEISAKIIFQVSTEKTICDKLISNALKLCNEAIAVVNNELYIDGIYEAFDLPDFANMARIRELFNAIKDKHLIIKFLDEIMRFSGVQVFIGSENPFTEMKDLSIVASTYHDGRRTLGSIGIIGPTRMNYSDVISIVDHTAKTITQILSAK
ncbi:MAG TPA: heat-inducible transcription repressor HrcA [Nitrospiraceae bacterium]|nr:heat-inducible transcription repressor HrcA [Nitrospiraceae bacterium]